MKPTYFAIATSLVFTLAAGCQSAPTASSNEEPAQSKPQPEVEDSKPETTPRASTASEPLVGDVERDVLLAKKASWSKAFAEASADSDGARALAEVEPGARVVVYLGAWCSDSVREVTRFWRALDAVGQVPFDVRYVGLDRQFEAGDVPLEGLEIEAVPTFIVYRDGAEVGRVVERSPSSIEADLRALLTGERTGKLSATR